MKFDKELFYSPDEYVCKEYPELLKDGHTSWLYNQLKNAREAFEKHLEGISELNKVKDDIDKGLVVEVSNDETFVPKEFTEDFITYDCDQEILDFLERYYDVVDDNMWVTLRGSSTYLIYDSDEDCFEVAGGESYCSTVLDKKGFKEKIGMI